MFFRAKQEATIEQLTTRIRLLESGLRDLRDAWDEWGAAANQSMENIYAENRAHNEKVCEHNREHHRTMEKWADALIEIVRGKQV